MSKQSPQKVNAHKERRKREIEAIKILILKAARDLAVQGGWPEVSIRKIGYEIQYTPPVIYEHFKNKEAILIELEAMGFRMLKQALEEARATTKDPNLQLEAVSAALWDWAFKHAELYEVMFNLQGIISTPPNTEALKESATGVIEILRQIQLFNTEIEPLFFNWWALVHGQISLVMSGQIRGMNNKMRTYMLSGVRRLSGAK